MLVHSTKYTVQRGQALVLVLLSLAVVLTLVLFILSRSITDISVSSKNGEAVRAFSAAEAGVEQALVIGSASGASVPVGGGDASYKASVTGVARNASGFVYPNELNSGDSMTLWLKAQDAGSSDFAGNTLKICWGKPGTYVESLKPAVEFILFYETTANDPSTVKIFRGAFDDNSTRRISNSFTAPGSPGSCAGQSFQFQTTLSLAGLPNPQFAIIRMFYNTDTAQPVAFDSTNASTFPSQGILVDSTGAAGQSNRRVEVFQGWPEIPNVFQLAIFSSTGITK